MINLHQFIVAGTPTAGKSTFSHKLIEKYFVQHICIDPIIEGFEDVFPELGITHNANTHEAHVEVCQKFRPFVSRMIDGLDVDNFVIEGFRLPIADLHDKYPHLQYFAFGYPSDTPESRLALCRKHDTDNWTNEETDEELLKTFTFLIDESKRLEEVCKERNIPFFDTTQDYWGSIDAALHSAK
ncbi:MAG: hypothetical protein AAB573_01725 [Patescibacteria group bacterium]